ncbi:hypothetical protein JCM5296_006416 [Sporobolomyces johnsonii]
MTSFSPVQQGPVGYGSNGGGVQATTGGGIVTTQGQSNVLEPIGRPGIGENGIRVELIANTYDCVIDKTQSRWFKYEVIITASARTRSDGSTAPPRALPKHLYLKIWRQVEQMERRQQTAHFGGVRPAFDGRAAAYTSAKLPADRIAINGIASPDGRPGTFEIVVQNPIPIPLASLRNYCSGQGAVQFGDTMEALQALNVLVRHGPASLFVSTNTSFFVSDEAARKFPSGTVRKESLKLVGGLELWRTPSVSLISTVKRLTFLGTSNRAVRTCERGLHFNIDTTSTVFVQHGNVVDFCLAYLANTGVRDPGAQHLAVGTLAPTDYIRLNRFLKKLNVTVRRGAAGRDLRFRVRGEGLKAVAANQATFLHDGRTTDVKTYLLDNFGVRLNYPELPLLEVKPGTLYPLELCYIDEGNKYWKRLSPQQQLAASSFQTLEPVRRLAAITAMRSNAVDVAHLDQFGVSIGPNPKTLVARVLPPPCIDYLGLPAGPASPPRPLPSVSVEPDDGEWQQHYSRQTGIVNERFVNGAALSSLAVIVQSGHDTKTAHAFVAQLLKRCAALGMNLSKLPFPFPQQCVCVKRPNESVRQVVDRAVEQGRGVCHGVKPQIIFYVFGQANDPDYNPFKRRTVELGIGSQALQGKKLQKNKDNFQFHLNVAMKVNLKCHGFGFRLKAGSTGGFLERTGGFLEREQPMIFGADLSHQVDKPSIAAVVGSMHNQLILFEESLKMQGLVEPGPGADTARARKQETIEHLEEMVLFLLRRRIMSLGRCPPASILFYRDGVSESEWAALLERGGLDPNIKRAFSRLKQDEDMLALAPELAQWEPKLTFIACLKRHHLRAFEQKGTRVDNIVPGTVIDTGIVDARAFDFYAAAHKGLLGTTRPTRYVVLADEQNMSADDVQGATNSLCYAYQRCNRSVSVPAPVYYADLLARRVRPWMTFDDDSQSATSSAPSATPQSRASDLAGCENILRETERGRDAFRGVFQVLPPAMWWC